MGRKDPIPQPPRTQATAVSQLNNLVLTSSLEQVNKQIGRYEQEMRSLREARFALEDTLTELRDMAIAARTMVHEYERRLGLAKTPFPPLPRPGVPATPPAA